MVFTSLGVIGAGTTALTIGKNVLPVLKPIGRETGNIVKNPLISFFIGIFVSLIPINPINIIILLILSTIIYYINPKFLIIDDNINITFTRSVLFALIPYFLITIPLYSLSANFISRIISKI